MKPTHFFIAIFMLSTIHTLAQSADRWKIMMNKKRITSGASGSAGEAVISAISKGKFTVQYSGTHKDASRRSIIIFDTDRHELLRKEIPHTYGTFTFSIDTLKARSMAKQFRIYTVAIPKNREQAALVRVMPILLCTVNWKD